MDNLPQNELMEQYLDRLCARLYFMSSVEKSEVRQETKQHLEAIAAAHQQEGMTAVASVNAALQQFGDSRKISHEIMQARNKNTQARIEKEIPAAVKRKMRIISALAFAASGLILILWYILQISHNREHFSWWITVDFIACWGCLMGFFGAFRERMEDEVSPRFHRVLLTSREHGILICPGANDPAQEQWLSETWKRVAEMKMPPLSEPKTLRRRISYQVKKWQISDTLYVWQQFDDRWNGRPLRFSASVVARKLAWLLFLLLLPREGFWSIFKWPLLSWFAFLNAAAITGAVAYRAIYWRRHRG